MEKEKVKEALEKLPEIAESQKTFFAELKQIFASAFPAKKEEPAKEAEPAPAEPAKEPAKVEFNHEEFTKTYNEFKSSTDEKFKSYDEKLAAFEAQLKTANETIVKQTELLSKTKELIEKLPSAFSTQKPKDSVKTKTEPVKDFQKEANDWFHSVK